MTRPSLFIVAALLALTLVACGGGGNRPARVYAPVPQVCPRGYTRINDAECWDKSISTPAPYPSPTGTLIYFPTVTPTAEEAAATLQAPALLTAAAEGMAARATQEVQP